MTATPTRVLHVTTSSAIGGAERLLTDVLRNAPPGRTHPVVCTLAPPGDLQRELAGIGVESFALGFSHRGAAARALRDLRRHIQAEHYDVVHTHLVHASAIGLLAARWTATPVAVMTRHYGHYVRIYGTRVDRLLDRVSNVLADRIFAISNAVRDVLVEGEGVPADRVETVPNGVDAARVRRQAGARVLRQDARLKLVTVASLHPAKGQTVLLDASRRLLDSGLAVEVVLVGGGQLDAVLRQRVRELDLESYVRFVGYVANPYIEMAAADIYVQPSLDEGFGISVLEAMALELPVIASATGGLPEIVVDGTNGLLVTPGDAIALAAAIQRLEGDRSLRDRLARRGHAAVTTSFDARRVARRYADAYELLLRDQVPGTT